MVIILSTSRGSSMLVRHDDLICEFGVDTCSDWLAISPFCIYSWSEGDVIWKWWDIQIASFSKGRGDVYIMGHVGSPFSSSIR